MITNRCGRSTVVLLLVQTLVLPKSLAQLSSKILHARDLDGACEQQWNTWTGQFSKVEKTAQLIPREYI